jgi:hypothetical protein
MITNNRLEKSFGPVGSVAGLLIFFAGIYTTFTSLTGVILILLGAFVGFTTTSALIDFKKKKVKLSNNIFGIIKIGHWINLDSSMKIVIRKSNRVWRTYSRSNRSFDISDDHFELILYDSTGKPIIPVKKVTSLKAAESERDSLSRQLELLSAQIY